ERGVLVPDLTENASRPAGIHPATMSEIASRYGREPELRRVQVESLRWLVDLAKRVGAQRLMIDGSFVTDKWEPNNVDCVLLRGPAFPQDDFADAELWAGLPFIQMVIVAREECDLYVEEIYATDWHGQPKGMVEVLL